MTTPSQLKFYGSQTLNDNWFEERATPLNGVVASNGASEFGTTTSDAFAPRAAAGSTRANRTCARAASRSNWPSIKESMVQVSTFGEVMEPRATGKPEHGIFATLPRHQQGFDARVMSTMTQSSYGVPQRRSKTEQRRLAANRPAAGARVAPPLETAAGAGEGLAGEVLKTQDDPQQNTAAQRAWMYARDPSITLRTNQRLGLTNNQVEEKQDFGASLPGVGEKNPHDCKPGPRVSTTLTKGSGGIFMDD